MPESEKDAAISVGSRLGGAPLLEQSVATRAQVMTYLQVMKDAGRLRDADIAELDAAIAAVHKGLEDYSLASSEAHTETVELTVAIHNLKSARRNLMNSVERVFRHDPQYTEFRQGTYHGTNVTALCVDLTRKIAFAKQHAAALAPVGISSEFLTNFEAQVHTVELASGQQDQKLAALPTRTRAYCEAKGRLYFILRNLNNAGRAQFSDDQEMAAQFNLKRLYSRGRGKTEPPVVPEPPVSGKKSETG